MTKDHAFQQEIISKIKAVMVDKALRGDNNNYHLKLTASDIRLHTGRKRLKIAILESFSKAFLNAGFDSKVDFTVNVIDVVVLPILADKEVNSLSDLLEREAVLKQIQLRNQ